MSKDELSEFASLMVDEIISRVRIQLDAGEGLSVADQRHMLAQLITERNRLAATRLEALQAQPVGALRHEAENMWIEFSHLVEGNNREQVIDIIAAELEKHRLPLAALTASPPVVGTEDEDCPHCHGEGSVEHPHLTGAYGGSHAVDPPDPVFVECEDCHGTGKVESDD